jgi:hypothetical protein
MEDWERKGIDNRISRLEDRLARAERRNDERVDFVLQLMLFAPTVALIVLALIVAAVHASGSAH